MDYFIVNVTPYSYEPLAIYDSYDEADRNHEHFCNVYPHGCIDILSEEELIDAEARELALRAAQKAARDARYAARKQRRK